MRFLGNLETFDLASMLFYLIGMVFGTTFSMAERVDALDWIHAPLSHRIARIVLAVVIILPIYYLFSDMVFTVNSQVEMS